MTLEELVQNVAKGEDSENQFKEDVTSPESLAAEIVSFLNAKGGTIYIGIDDSGELKGLSAEDVRRVNQMISNVASQHIRNPVSVTTENIRLENGSVVVALHVPEGGDKPYFDRNGSIWLKEGADKRRAVSREEIRRFFEASAQIFADEQPTRATMERLDVAQFRHFFESTYREPFPSRAADVIRLLKNMNLAVADGHLNLAGLLFFGMAPEFLVPQFCIKAVRMNGVSLGAMSYSDSEDYSGTLPAIFSGAMAFLSRNLHKRQTIGGVNAPGESEINPSVLEEILVNALVHRDYFINAPIRVLVFDDRVEVVSPGSLPNHLTVEKILAGNTNIRNPVLATFVAKGLLPYHGLGSGVMRAKELCPGIRFADDRLGAQFKVTIPRLPDGSASKVGIGDARGRILEAFRANPTLAMRALASQMGISLSSLQGHVASLKLEGWLEREGGTRGRWRVVER